MCGRYSLTEALDTLAAFFGLYQQPKTNLAPRWNIAPTQQSAIIRSDSEGRRELAMLRWGFAGPNNAPLINARSETVISKPSFAEAFRRRRCLVPADSFYEWQVLDGQKTKQPWRIGLRGGGLFAFAGLWQTETAFGGAECFTIITTAANTYLAPLHERMPVILPTGAFAAWLDPATPVNDLVALLRPYADEKMARYRVTAAVNSVKTDSPDCFAPLNPNLRTT